MAGQRVAVPMSDWVRQSRDRQGLGPGVADDTAIARIRGVLIRHANQSAAAGSPRPAAAKVGGRGVLLAPAADRLRKAS